MSLLTKVKKGFCQPNLLMRKLWQASSRLIHDDKLYLSVSYRLSHGKAMNWEAPSTFNEKITWLKLWSKGRGFERYVDKYEVRKYVTEQIGEEYLIPLLGVWDKFEDIDFSTLPENYVLKTTHDSGGVVIVKGKMPNGAGKFLSGRMRYNYFYRGREYPYRNVVPRIVAEQYMVDESGWDLKDYKFFCFNGVPRILFLAAERFKTKGGKAKFDYFDMNLERLPFSSRGHDKAYEYGARHEPIPGFENMVKLAGKLSQGFPFIRIDFYDVNGRVYFGEMTFFHDDGLVPFEPAEWDLKLGEMIELPSDQRL